MRGGEAVVNPEEVLLGLRVPADRERLVPQALTEDLLRHRHSLLLRPMCRRLDACLGGLDVFGCLALLRGEGLAGLVPIGPELDDALVGQWMVDHLLEDLER